MKGDHISLNQVITFCILKNICTRLLVTSVVKHCIWSPCLETNILSSSNNDGDSDSLCYDINHFSTFNRWSTFIILTWSEFDVIWYEFTVSHSTEIFSIPLIASFLQQKCVKLTILNIMYHQHLRGPYYVIATFNFTKTPLPGGDLNFLAK